MERAEAPMISPGAGNREDPFHVDTDTPTGDAQRQIARLQRQLDELVEYLPVALVEINLMTRAVTRVNRLARIVFGYGPNEELSELTVRDLFPPRELGRMAKLAEDLVTPSLESGLPYERTGTQDIVETVLRHHDGTEFPAEIEGSFVLNEQGQPRRLRLVCRDISERKALEAQREHLVTELRAALANVKTLHGLLPICAWCKKVRDDRGYWDGLEEYVRTHSETTFSHGICPDCAQNLYPQQEAI